MNNPRNDDPLYEGNHVLTHDRYLELNMIHDKLMLMAQLAIGHDSAGEMEAHFLVRRAVLGEIFGDFGVGIGLVLESLVPFDALAAGE